MIRFVESKMPDLGRVARLLDECAAKNHWANRGPLYELLSEKYVLHFGLDKQMSIVPCANAGIALEAMARLLCLKEKRKLKWVGSAFSFQNLGRGYFADMEIIDCTETGLLNLDIVSALPQDSFDGIIVVNPFGLFENFESFIDFAKKTGKFLLIDNAAGIHRHIPVWPWQAFSLHHTKPYGVGEGGLACIPSELSDEFYSLINYGSMPDDANTWLNNGKLSDIACAFHIDRLERLGTWEPLYLAQAQRVERVARSLGLSPLCDVASEIPAMSRAFVAEKTIPLERVAQPGQLAFGKYYKPLANLPQASGLYGMLLNIPTHPDVALISDDELEAEISRVIG